MKYVELADAQYDNYDFDEQSFLGSEFRNCIFLNCSFQQAYLTGTQFIECQFFSCSFNDSYIFRSLFKNCEIIESTFNNAMVSTVDFTGTNFSNVEWLRDCVINSPPVIIDGIEYPVTAFDNGHMQVGCHYASYDWFWNTDDKYSAKLEGLKARRFWKKNKEWIFKMLEARGLYAPATL